MQVVPPTFNDMDQLLSWEAVKVKNRMERAVFRDLTKAMAFHIITLINRRQLNTGALKRTSAEMQD